MVGAVSFNWSSKRFLLILILALASGASAQNSKQSIKGYELPKNASLKDHLVQSYQRVYLRMGVTPGSLTAFSKSIQMGPKSIRTVQIFQVSQSSGCVAQLADSDQGRSALLECLAGFGRIGLTETLFDRVFQARSSRIKQIPTTPEIQKTVALLLWIQDLVRSKLLSIGISAVWYVPSKGFLASREKGDFEYEDGDVALVTGKSSISSMISQVTYPQRKFSHAFVVRKEKNEFATVEALIESGVISNSLDVFNKENLQIVEIHRWADESTRRDISTKASNEAWKWVVAKTPYDFNMDMKTEDKLFCSEVVARAYSQATGLAIEEFVPELSRIRSKPVFNFISKMGVTSELMPSPGDLAPSKYLKQVAEYRNPDDLSKLWWLMAMGDVVIERLEAGYELHPRLWVGILAQLGVTLDSAIDGTREVFGVDMNLLPQGLNRTSIATMLTLQKLLYEKAFVYAEETLKAAGYVNPHDLLSVEPWVLRAHFSYAVQQSYFPRRVLKK